MITYKLLRMKNGKLYPLYVEADRELPIGEWLNAQIGPKADETHVKARISGGQLSLRPGFHSTDVPFADWIGTRVGDKLYQRPTDVWCECEVTGNQMLVSDRNGLRSLPDGWYFFKTNTKQIRPWIISDRIKINKILTEQEVYDICLDTENEKYIQDTLREQLKNKTVIMIAHRLSTIVAADKIIMLDHGRVVAQGSHEDLLARSEAYRSLIRNQLIQY